MIENGSVVTYVGKWPARCFGCSDYLQPVFSDLSNAGLTIRGQQTSGALSIAAGLDIDVTLTLQVENGLGFNSPDDIISIIRHWVYIETQNLLFSGGKYPSADSIPSYRPPNVTTDIPTGQPTPTGSKGAHVCGDSSWGFFDDPGQWISCLTAKGLSTLGLVFIGLAIGIAFILFAEHEV